MQKLYPWLLTALVLLISSAAAASLETFVSQSELIGFMRVIFAAIPGTFASFVFNSSRRRKPDVFKNLFSGFMASVLVAVQRDWIKIPMTLSLEFAFAGIAGVLGGEYVSVLIARVLGLKGGDKT